MAKKGQTIDILHITQYIVGVVVISMSSLLLFGILNLAENTKVNDIPSNVLFLLSGILLLPLNFSLSKKTLSTPYRIIIAIVLFLVALMIL